MNHSLSTLPKFFLFAMLLSPFTSSSASESVSFDACSPSESWKFSNELNDELSRTLTLNEFHATTSGKHSSFQAVAESFTLKRLSERKEARLFAEYWLSRSLYRLGLSHIAYASFLKIIENQDAGEQALGIQLSSFLCANKIRSEIQSLKFSPLHTAQVLRALTFLKDSKEMKFTSTLRNALSDLLFTKIADESEKQNLLVLFSHLSQDDEMKLLADAMKSYVEGNALASKAKLDKVLTGSVPASLKPYLNRLVVLKAHLEFEASRFKEATFWYEKVDRRSNELVSSLIHKAWAHLELDEYGSAVGSGLALSTKAFERTFAPESYVITAIAFNETCQFPESLKSLELFNKNYTPILKWLSQNQSIEKYPILVRVLKNTVSADKTASLPPQKIMSEWMRSPVFLTNQSEINLLIREEKSLGTLLDSAKKEQKSTLAALLIESKELLKKYQLAKIKLKPGEEISNGMKNDIFSVKERLTHFDRFKRSAVIFKTVLSTQSKIAVKIREARVKEIESELTRLTQKMFGRLEELKERAELIEVEIYNGAADDIIFQNAFPEFQKIAKEMGLGQKKVSNDQALNWGKRALASDTEQELWEDELGSLSADVFNNCDNKEKYLSLRRASQ